jgi:hypothetical protein
LFILEVSIRLAVNVFLVVAICDPSILVNLHVSGAELFNNKSIKPASTSYGIRTKASKLTISRILTFLRRKSLTNLEAALEQFREIAADLDGETRRDRSTLAKSDK